MKILNLKIYIVAWTFRNLLFTTCLQGNPSARDIKSTPFDSPSAFLPVEGFNLQGNLSPQTAMDRFPEFADQTYSNPGDVYNYVYKKSNLDMFSTEKNWIVCHFGILKSPKIIDLFLVLRTFKGRHLRSVEIPNDLGRPNETPRD